MSPLQRLLDRVLPPTGVHRGPRAGAVVERLEVPLDDLFGPPLPVFAEVPHGTVAPQAFRHCTQCGGDVAVVLHPSGAHTCDGGHLTVPANDGEG
jgi:hypothetical protein